MLVSERTRRKRIAEAAYYRSERRGFSGDPVTDWLEAEKQIDAELEQDEGLLCLFEVRLAWASQRLHAFSTHAPSFPGAVRQQWEERVNELRCARDRLQDLVRTVQHHGGHAGESTVLEAETIWLEIARAIEALGAGAMLPTPQSGSARREPMPADVRDVGT